MNKAKIKKIKAVRFCVQILGILLTIIAFFTNFPIAMTLIIGVTFFIGPIFCGWICPYGFLQDLFSKLGKTLGIKKRKMPKKIQHILVFSRYIILVFVLLVSWDLIFNILSYDPRANLVTILIGRSITFISFIILIGFLAISLFFERPFCNYICIEGAKYGIFSIFRPITIKRDIHSCVGCGICDKICPMNIEISKYKQVRSIQCINCFKCVGSCPVKNTLTFGITPNKKVKKELLPLIITATLFFFIYITYNANELINVENITSSQCNSENDNTQLIDRIKTNNYKDTSEIHDDIYTHNGNAIINSLESSQSNTTEEVMQTNIIENNQEIVIASSVSEDNSIDNSSEKSTFKTSDDNTYIDSFETSQSNTTDELSQANATENNNQEIVTSSDSEDNLVENNIEKREKTDDNNTDLESSQNNTEEALQTDATENNQEIVVTPSHSEDNSIENSTNAETDSNTNIDTYSEDTITTTTENDTTTTTAQDGTENDTNNQVTQDDNIQVYGDAAGIADGVYSGTGKGYKGDITVQITIKNQLITEIAVTQKYDDMRWFNRAFDTIVPKIINSQTTSVDTVSGATFSSKGIIDAVKDALTNTEQ